MYIYLLVSDSFYENEQMSIIKAINDAIITKNDIIGVLFTTSVTSFRNNRYRYWMDI